eukprot:597187-Heterocapsa_arctica.AAC.1
MTERKDSKGRGLMISLWDVSRAHFYRVSRIAVYTTLPEGLKELGFAALLFKTMYGTQDAANVWMDTWGDALRENVVKKCASNPSVFASEILRGFCHGDDSCVVAFGGARDLRLDLEEQA